MFDQINPRCPKCRQVLIHPDECLQCGPITQRVSGVLPVVVFGTIILGVVGVGVLVLLQYVGNPLYLFGKLRLFKPYEVSRPASDFVVSRQSPPALSVEDYLGLRELLETRQFAALNDKIDRYQKSAARSPDREYLALDSIEVFQLTRESDEELLSAWVDDHPRHYTPYLARASYYFAKGWQSRGYKFAKDTSPEQFEGMRSFFAHALRDIEVALSRQPELMPAYALLISIHNASGDKSSKSQIVRRALELFPQSFIIHAAALRTLEPRWGGSHRQMEELVKQAEPNFESNPRLIALYGYIYYDQARNFGAEEKHQDAARMFTRAMDYGDYFRFYFERAEVYHFDLNDRAQALQDVNRSIELRPASPENYRLRSRIYFALERFDESLADLRVAVRLWPADKSNHTWMEWASTNLVNRGHNVFKQDLDRAALWYSQALEFNARNADAYYGRAVVHQRRSRLDLARADLDRAIEVNPRHFDSYLLMDHVLLTKRDFDTIIAYWNRFLELEPAHARAFLERAGTHYHKGENAKFLADLKRSCELGNAEACKLLKQKGHG